ncbi:MULTISPECIES: acyl-CoA desaturase [unclassified Roseateles]|uniref:acyl-CoA desaturase n=1 Tax=unclassified Roseateles TaxID=2626991 RepID=UPI000B0F5A30|nr:MULTISPECIES: acyl-CoA desaturase [unclassified Roseateles]
MPTCPAALDTHRVRAVVPSDVLRGRVAWSPLKSLWFTSMALAAVIGGLATFTWAAFGVFLASTAFVLLFGHSLGSHRKLIHDSFQTPKWLEYALVYSGVQVGLAGPLGLLRQHELRDYAQRLPDCHDYLRHGSSFWRDAWWQLHCELRLEREPAIHIESRIAGDRFYRFLERTWMLQQFPPALLLFAVGGWSFVFWGTCARVTACVFGHWLIGYFAHNHGGMHHVVDGAAVQGRNIPLTSLLTMGESWHNNHHAFPGSARLGLYAGEWDPGWWMLLVLRKLGLIWSIRLPEDLAMRPELRALDGAEPASAALGSPRFADAWRLLANAHQDGIHCEGPATLLSAELLHRLLGAGFTHRPAARRLSVTAAGVQLAGLPALCIALAARSGAAKLLAILVLPLAFAAEQIRQGLRYG